jgi:Mrp family chromosome partitioning ATPase
VIHPGKTPADAARTSLELFKRAGARVIGTVLNRIPRNRDYYYGGYKYYSPYNESKGYYGKEDTEPVKKPVLETAPKVIELPTDPSYSFLNRVTRRSQDPDDLPPPDPQKK